MPVRHFIALKPQGLLLLIAILVITAANCRVSQESYKKAKIMAQEDALVAALKYTREAIRDYKADHGKPPHQLKDLVTSGYFDSLPIDPMTNKADWSTELEPCPGHGPCEKFIKDVHSSCTAKSSKNNLYSAW